MREKEKKQNNNNKIISCNKKVCWMGAVAQACNPSTLGGQAGVDHKVRSLRSGQHGETPSPLKIQKISWAWWCMPVIPDT